MSLFERVHNDPRLGLQRGRMEEVEVAKECDAVGKRSERLFQNERAGFSFESWGGITNFGQKFPPDSRLADWSRGCISKRANK